MLSTTELRKTTTTTTRANRITAFFFFIYNTAFPIQIQLLAIDTSESIGEIYPPFTKTFFSTKQKHVLNQHVCSPTPP